MHCGIVAHHLAPRRSRLAIVARSSTELVNQVRCIFCSSQQSDPASFGARMFLQLPASSSSLAEGSLGGLSNARRSEVRRVMRRSGVGLFAALAFCSSASDGRFPRGLEIDERRPLGTTRSATWMGTADT
eukprot:scaffold9132_cov112-Isochrysis_galbana.AAC.4